MGTWTARETFGLVGKSYLWMVGVTTPTVLLVCILVSLFSGADGSALFLGMTTVFIAGIISIGGAAVALPFTYVTGRLLTSVRNTAVHVATHSVVAGALAAGCMQGVVAFSGGGWIWQFPLLVSAPAGAAAAIATWRHTHPKPAQPVRDAVAPPHRGRPDEAPAPMSAVERDRRRC